jgi:enoyl-CoA hydratase/carnithine racemase
MDALRIERDDDVLRITLARPETRNAFDARLIEELAEAFVDVGTSRAVVLSGEGPSFCAGADVDWMRRSSDLTLDENVADANGARRPSCARFTATHSAARSGSWPRLTSPSRTRRRSSHSRR